MFKTINKEIITDSAEIIKSVNKKTAIPSIISKGMDIIGDLCSENIIEIFGKVKGDIKADIIRIRENARVEGNLHAKYIQIAGTFEGNATCAVIHVLATGFIKGNLEYGLISVEEKAQITGQLIGNSQLLQLSIYTNDPHSNISLLTEVKKENSSPFSLENLSQNEDESSPEKENNKDSNGEK